MAIDKAREEVHQLHLEDPTGAPEENPTVPLADPNDATGRLRLEHYKRCILAQLTTGAPKQKSLNKVQGIQQKSDEDPSAFLQGIY